MPAHLLCQHSTVIFINIWIPRIDIDSLPVLKMSSILNISRINSNSFNTDGVFTVKIEYQSYIFHFCLSNLYILKPFLIFCKLCNIYCII